MIKNYIKVAWRNMMKNKTFSFINIFGLSIGLTCCMLISMYLYYELSYDSHHKNARPCLPTGNNLCKRRKRRQNGQHTIANGQSNADGFS